VICNDSRVVDDKERDGDEDENNVEDTSRDGKFGVQHGSLDWNDSILVLLYTGSGLVPAVWGMANWLAHKFL
jgi:hypothetical protein